MDYPHDGLDHLMVCMGSIESSHSNKLTAYHVSISMEREVKKLFYRGQEPDPVNGMDLWESRETR